MSKNHITRAVGDDADNNRLVAIELHSSGIDGTGQIPAVGIAAPTEIEMEIVIRLISITDKSVSSRTMTTIVHWLVGANILAQQITPLCISKIHFFCITEVRTEAEEIDKGSAGFLIVCTAFSCRITHVDSHSTITHQCGDSINLCRRAGGSECNGHIGIVIVSAVVIDGEGAVVAIVAVGSTPVDGIAPIVDDLCHGGGDTACDGVTGITVGIFRTHGVVILSLVPGGGQQRSDAVGRVGGYGYVGGG